MGRISRISLARPEIPSVCEATTPNVSLSAQTHSATRPSTLGTHAAAPPSDPALVVTAPGSLAVNVEMNELADVPDSFPPMNRMIWGPDDPEDPPPFWYTW